MLKINKITSAKREEREEEGRGEGRGTVERGRGEGSKIIPKFNPCKTPDCRRRSCTSIFGRFDPKYFY